MNCKDLTICDYIKHNGTIKIVDAVYLYSVSVYDPGKPWGAASSELISVDDIEPIKLTEEILVKNGFKKVNMTVDGDYRHYHLHGVCISWEEQSGFWYGEGDIEFKYVHQLQHLLRLCGIDMELTI